MKPRFIAGLLISALILAARPGYATNRTVTSPDDSGAGSLRAVIAASGNGDSIDFAITGTITLSSGELVVNHNIAINGPGAASLTVARSSIAGTPGFRVFNFSTGTSGGPIASISGLTVSNGKAGGGSPANLGGAILNDHGSLTVTACTISGNTADYGGGLASYGESNGSANLTVTGCSLSGNTAALAGGGIYSSGFHLGGGSATLNITSSVLSGNSGNTYGGGGIYNSNGSCTIQSSTLTGNHDGNTNISGGGAIYNVGNSESADLQVIESTLANNSANEGGAILNRASGQPGHATATLTNCTLSGNVAVFRGAAAYNTGGVIIGGGLQFPIATLTFMSCTLSKNAPLNISGAGLTNFSSDAEVSLTLTLGNTILDKPPGTGRANIDSGAGATVTSLGFNLCNDSGGGHLTSNGDQINTDPKLDPSGLQSNGGPTQTIALTLGSAAIDKGKSFGVTVDQREQPRPIENTSVNNAPGGDGSDVGAYEAPADPLQSGMPSFVVRLLDDHDDGVCAASDCTLREAIAAVQRRGSGSITFSTKTNNAIVLQDQLDVNVPTNIMGNGARFTVISGNEAHRVFSFNAGTSVLSEVTIRDGWNAGSSGGVTRMGGGIFNQATLTLSDCTLTNNFVQGGGNNDGVGGAGGSAFGGGVYNTGTLTLDRCTFYGGSGGNVAAGGGGANASGVGQSGGTGGDGAGGGVYNDLGGRLTINNSTFNGNSCAGGNGGNSTLSLGGNGGHGRGGAICNLGTMLVTAATMDGNFGAGGSGGTGSHGSNGGNGKGVGGVAAIAGSSSTLRNTLSAGNGGASGGGKDADGSFISEGYNLIGTADHATGFTAIGDQSGTDASTIDPRLGPLQNNGGGTDTMAALVSPPSPAIDKGKSFALTTDQRSLARPIVSPLFPNAPGGDGSDIGAFEVQAAAFPTPTATATATASPKATPTATAKPTATPTATASPKATATGTAKPTATATATASPKATPSATASATGTPGRTSLVNISTRLSVQTGDDVLIGGFIITGTQPKKVITRAIGPSLPLPGVLADPTLELYQGNTLLEADDNWVDSPEKQLIIDSTIPPRNNLESAIVRTLPANGTGYTAIVRGANSGTGIGLVEAYDLDRSVDSKLANISTRGLVQTGDDVLIAGTIILGQAPQKVIVRAIGPSLSLPGKLADPTLQLVDENGAVLEENDNWVDSPNKQAIIDSTIPPSNDKESAIVRTLPANGAQYTAIVRGVNNTSGIGVVEVYALQ